MAITQALAKLTSSPTQTSLVRRVAVKSHPGRRPRPPLSASNWGLADIYPEKAHLGPGERHRILQLVEKNHKDRFYCEPCTRLFSPSECLWPRCCSRTVGIGSRKDHEFELEFHRARKAMLAHLRGSEHGRLQLEELVGLSTRWTSSAYPSVCFNREPAAKLIDDTLLSFKWGVFQGHQTTPGALRECIDQAAPRACRHLALGDVLDNALRETVSRQAVFARVHANKSCPMCMTDFDLDILGGEADGWNVHLKSYHRLGRVLDLDDDWNWMASGRGSVMRAELGTWEAQPGQVRRAWHKGDGKRSVVPRGEWEMLPP